MHGLKFDKAVAEWYLQNDIEYKHQYLEYLQHANFCDEKGNMVDDQSYDELDAEFDDEMKINAYDISEALIYADPNFPVPSWLNLQKQERKLFVFNVLRLCWLHKKSPTIEEMAETISLFIAEEYNISTNVQLVINASYLICETFENTQRFYNYIQLITTLCIYHGNMFEFNTKMGTIGIINYNLHHKGSKKKRTIYGVISCVNNKRNKKSCKLSAFMSASDLQQTYNIHPKQLPKSSCFSKSKNNKNISSSHNSHKQHNSDTNYKSRNGKKGKNRQIRIGNTYDSCRGFEVKNNIYIPPTLTDRYGTIAYTIKGMIPNIYEYICKLTPLLIDINVTSLKNGDLVAINYDFRHKQTNEPLYCIIERQNANANRGYKFRMHNKLYKKQEIPNNISISIINSEIHKSKIFKSRIEIHKNKIKALLSNDSKRQALICKCQWHKIDMFNRQNNRKRMTYAIDKQEFITECNTQFNNNNNNLIPILMFNDSNDGYSFEFIKIISIESAGNIGIAFGYNEQTQRVTINGIHVDKQYIMNQHQLISPEHNKECRCLNEFSSHIQVLQIGNPDNDKNRAKQYEEKSRKMWEFIQRDIIKNPAAATVLNINGVTLYEAAKAACSNSKEKYVVSSQQQNVSNPQIINQYYYVMPPPPPPVLFPTNLMLPPACNFNGYIDQSGKTVPFPALSCFNNGYNNFNNNLNNNLYS